MRATRNATLGIVSLLAALALWAPAVSADPVEVEDNGVHCSDVVPHPDGHEVEGGCHLEAFSIGTIDFEIDVHPTGAHSQGPLCEQQFEMRLDGAGEGYVQHFNMLPGDPFCGHGLRTCNEAEAHGGGDGPWRVHTEETGPVHETATVEVCLIISGVGRCEGPVGIELTQPPEVEVEEQFYLGASSDSIPCNNNPAIEAEFAGEYVFLNEPEEEVHIIHPID